MATLSAVADRETRRLSFGAVCSLHFREKDANQRSKVLDLRSPQTIVGSRYAIDVGNGLARLVRVMRFTNGDLPVVVLKAVFAQCLVYNRLNSIILEQIKNLRRTAQTGAPRLIVIFHQSARIIVFFDVTQDPLAGRFNERLRNELSEERVAVADEGINPGNT
jgi:hypothetical protein